jgi:tetratricopeptide (TPR) repeat protein
MEASHLERVRSLAEATRILPAGQRAAFLDESCGDDPGLRRAVEALLAAEAPSDPFHLVGRAVGPYQVREWIGGGGMGGVYRAEDARLRRTVALKFLPPTLGRDAARRRRFEQEAQAASALDDPNICTIHGIGETDDGQLYLVMACYEGETVAQKIARDPLPVGEALDIAVQAARGLAKAHARGIVHRDIKPANLMVTREGVVKVLDFGLAKLSDGVQLTQPGLTMGTTAYMSPEQTRGEEVDRRTDLWSLGVVLYEMLAGARPFAGAYAAAQLYSIVNEEPAPLGSLRSDLPPGVAQVVERCLRKDPAQRYPRAEALLADLERLLHPEAASASLAPAATVPFRWSGASPRGKRSVLAAAGAGLLLLVVLLGPWDRGASDETGAMRLAVMPFQIVGGAADDGFGEGLRLSLTSLLSQVGGAAEIPVEVVPASEVGTTTSVEEARRRFGIREALTGSIQVEDETVRLVLNLIDAEALTLRRSETISLASGNVATLDRVALARLSDLLDLALPPSVLQRVTAGGTDSDRAYEFYLKGNAALTRFENLENIDTALQLYAWALEEDSLYAVAYAGRGRAFWAKYVLTQDAQWVARAEESCQRALALESRLAPVHETLGRLYRGTGAYERALREYKLALALDSASADAHRGLASTYASLERPVEAEAHFRRAVALQPGYWEQYNDLGAFYLDAGRFEEAAAQFEQVVALHPDHIWGYNNLGAAYLYQDRLDEAQAMFERSIGIKPNDFAYSNLGYISYRQQRPEEEAEMYRQALALDSSDFRVWGNLAGAYERLGEESRARDTHQRAAQMIKAALEVNPNDPDLLYHLASHMLPLGRKEQALALLERALALAPENVNFMAGAVFIYAEQEMRDEALHWMEAALESGYPASVFEDAAGLQQLRADPRYLKLIEQARSAS